MFEACASVFTSLNAKKQLEQKARRCLLCSRPFGLFLCSQVLIRPRSVHVIPPRKAPLPAPVTHTHPLIGCCNSPPLPLTAWFEISIGSFPKTWQASWNMIPWFHNISCGTKTGKSNDGRTCSGRRFRPCRSWQPPLMWHWKSSVWLTAEVKVQPWTNTSANVNTHTSFQRYMHCYSGSAVAQRGSEQPSGDLCSQRKQR